MYDAAGGGGRKTEGHGNWKMEIGNAKWHVPWPIGTVADGCQG